MTVDTQQRDRHIASLTRFITTAPEGSKALAVRIKPVLVGELAETLFTLDVAKAINQGAAEVAAEIYRASENWAEAQGRECTFTAHHLNASGEQMVGTMWRLEHKAIVPSMPFDGSANSALAQSQQHVHTILSQYLQGMEIMHKSYKEVIAMQARRITELEQQRDNLEKKVRTSDENEAELAMLAMESDRQKELLGLGERLFTLLSDAKKAMGSGKPLPVTTNAPASSAGKSDASALPSTTDSATKADASSPGTSDAKPASSEASSDANPEPARAGSTGSSAEGGAP